MDRSECGVRHKWDHVETERRREAFNAWVRTQANKAGFRLMPPAVQGVVHGMLRVAFYAGSNWQRRHGAIAAAPPPPAEQASGELPSLVLRRDSDGKMQLFHSVFNLRFATFSPGVLESERCAVFAALSQRPVVGEEIKIYVGFDKNMEKRLFHLPDSAWRHCIGAIDVYVKQGSLAPQQPEKGEG